MIIEIDLHVAHDREAMRSLDRIMLKVEDGWHLWQGNDLECFADSPWLRGDGRAEARGQELLRAAIARSAYPPGVHQRSVRVTLRPEGTDELAPDDAADLAEAPLTILVENREGDGIFVRRVAAELERTLWAHWQDDGHRVAIDSVGGKGQMALEVSRRCKGRVRPRLVVVVDSDRRAPSDPPSREAQALRELCSEHGVSCWVLRKREAENYLPQALLEARADAGVDHQRRVDAWAQLNDDQKDHFDMKDGFPEGAQGTGAHCNTSCNWRRDTEPSLRSEQLDPRRPRTPPLPWISIGGSEPHRPR